MRFFTNVARGFRRAAVIRWKGLPLIPLLLLATATPATALLLVSQTYTYTPGLGISANPINFGTLTPGVNVSAVVFPSMLNTGTVNVPIILQYVNQTTTWSQIFNFVSIMIKVGSTTQIIACYEFGQIPNNVKACQTPTGPGLLPNQSFSPPGTPAVYDYVISYGVKANAVFGATLKTVWVTL